MMSDRDQNSSLGPLSVSASETVFLEINILGYTISVFRNSNPLSALLP